VIVGKLTLAIPSRLICTPRASKSAPLDTPTSVVRNVFVTCASSAAQPVWAVIAGDETARNTRPTLRSSAQVLRA
jgi:hypothetical protein